MPYPSLYRAKAVNIRSGAVDVFVPQVFGESQVTVTDALGSLPTAPTLGWVFFQAGNPEFPVWSSGLGVGGGDGGGGDPGNGNGGNGGGGTAVDEVWIGPDEPTGPQELWFDTDEAVPLIPLMTIKGVYYGTTTPLPAVPVLNDVWVIGTPVPTATPARGDGTGAAQVGDAIVWNDIAWLNIGAFRGPQGIQGDKGDPGVPQRQPVVAKGTVTSYTLALADEDKLLWFSANTGIALTIPTFATVPLPDGWRVDIMQSGAGRITVSGAGITLIATPTAVLRGIGSTASLLRLPVLNTWLLTGDMG